MKNTKFTKSMRKHKRTAKAAIRTFAEHLGIKKLSKPGLNGLDEKLSKYLNKREGYFIECGANDGFRQSNTYYLERFLGWTGLLIEPIPDLYEECRRLRKNSVSVNTALVSPEHYGNEIEITYAGLMSTVEGAFCDKRRAREHIDKGLRIQGIRSYHSVVPAITLSNLLDKLSISNSIDFFSLDVEGFELDVLRGLDITRHAPHFILVEARNPQEVAALLASRYKMIEQLTCHDYLFARIDV